MGAVTLRETASASPAARTNVFHTPKPDASSGNSMGIARLSPTSKTYRRTIVSSLMPKWTPLLRWSVASSDVMWPRDLTRLCFHEDTSSPMLSTGLRMTWCRNSPQSTVIELSLSILVLKQQPQQMLSVLLVCFTTYSNESVYFVIKLYHFTKRHTIKGIKRWQWLSGSVW